MRTNVPTSGDKDQWRLIVAAAGVSGLLGILTTLLAIGYLRQKDLRQVASAESLRAGKAAAGARDAANQGLRARDQAEDLVGFVLDELRDELIQLDRSELLGAAAEKAVAYFDQLPAELITPHSQSRRASVLLTLSDARYQQGDYAGAMAAAKRSIEYWRQLAATGDPDGNYTVRLGRALGELGLYQNQSKDHYAASQTFRELLRLYENPPSVLANDGWGDHGLAKAHMGLGEIERLKKNYPEARAAYAKAITHVTAALTRNSNELSWLQMFMTLHNNAGVTFMHDKDYPAAEEAFRRAVEPNRTLIRLEPKNHRWEKELATTLLNLGSLQHLQKNYAAAEPYIRESLALRQGIVNWDPKSARAIRKLAHAWHRLALLQFDTAKNSDALASARYALNSFRRLLNTDPDDSEAVGEIQEYSEKYRDRLVKAGMSLAARELIQETAAFAEANRAEKTSAPAWEKLLASLRASTAALDANPAAKP